MTTYLHILGRQPALGLAELEALFGAAHVQPIAGKYALVKTDSAPNFDRLGGSIKTGRVLTSLPSTDWGKLVSFVGRQLPDHLSAVPDGKVQFGISAYDLHVTPSRINNSTLELKKIIKQAGRSVRIVANTDTALSSAQTLHNRLTGERGVELMLVRDGSSTIIAEAVHVQNIESYTRRDRERPMRDAYVGMLPPKLAQIIINLASGIWNIEYGKSRSNNIPIATGHLPTVLDPFCGTGVVLQEALLMGYAVYGTDIDPRIVEFSRENIRWLASQFQTTASSFQSRIDLADATSASWQPPISLVASETYLGTPLKTLPAPVELDKIMNSCDTLHRAFLQNLAPQIASGTPLCLAVPAWRVGKSFLHLPFIDDLAAIGYNRIDFKHVRHSELLYHRESQLVARELLVLTRV